MIFKSVKDDYLKLHNKLDFEKIKISYLDNNSLSFRFESTDYYEFELLNIRNKESLFVFASKLSTFIMSTLSENKMAKPF